MYFELSADSDRFESLGVVGEDLGPLGAFLERELPPGWSPPVLEVLPEDEGNPLPESDFPRLLSFVPLLSSRAYRALEPLLVGSVEAAEFRVLGRTEPYYGLNVTKIIEAIDTRESQLLMAYDDQILVVNEYAFRHDLPTGLSIFRDRHFLTTPLVSQAFVDAVARASLVGARFRPC